VAKTPSQPPYFRIFQITPGRTVVLEGLTITGGYVSAEFGGGIVNYEATLTISNCNVSGNSSDGNGGGGIGNYIGTLTIMDSVVSNNWAGFTFGNPIGYGGGIENAGGMLTIIRSTISNNIAYFHGGGIYGAGTITITDSTISGNRSGLDAFEFSGGGGGILKSSNGGSLVISNSTISGNTARGGDGTGAGGGIFGDRVVIITNSTISGNFANQDGGGISGGESATTVTITNSTFSDNQANRNGGGIHHPDGGTFELKNIIMQAGISGANIFNNGGTVTSLGYNLSSDNGGGFLTASGDQINTAPMLGPLQDNGGPTFTHIPLTGSPAIKCG
jgi:predicted outer membrane repeat protein